MFNIGKTYKDEIIPRRTKWIYTVSGLGRDAVYAMVSVFLLTFITEAGYLAGDNFGAMFGVISGLIIGYRVFDAINDPFMGVIIEKAHMKTGKYKPWIFLGALTNTAVVLALFLTPEFCDWCHGWGFVAWFAVFYLLWGMTFTMNDIAFCSMLPSLSSNEQQRAKITSLLMIFENGGSFLVSLLIPMMAKPENLYTDAYWVAAIIIGALFVIGQGALFLFCHEHERDLKAEKKADPPKFKDMINILVKNKLVRLMAIVVFVWFISLFIMDGLLQNVFYLSVGYSAGKDLMSYFSFVKVGAIVLPMIFMPRILEKVPKMKVFKVSIITMIASYLLFFIYGAPYAGQGAAIAPGVHFGDPTLNTNSAAYATILFLIAFIMYVANSCTYNVIYLFMENTVEYNEYHFGQRKEAVIFSLRPFATKMASSIQILVADAALFSTGFINVSNAISEINDKYKDNPQAAAPLLEEEISKASNNLGMIYGMRIWCMVIPAILLILTMFLLVKFYDLSDADYRKMCKEIKKRRA
ncbi:MAG: MFS transporter [Bacilli bacterium]|nr:MFS transporter [Bacilli bacterium]